MIDLRDALTDLFRDANTGSTEMQRAYYAEFADQAIALVRKADADTRCCDVCGKRIVDDFYAACEDCEQAMGESRRG